MLLYLLYFAPYCFSFLLLSLPFSHLVKARAQHQCDQAKLPSCSGNDFGVIRAPPWEQTSSESKGRAWIAGEHPLLKQHLSSAGQQLIPSELLSAPAEQQSPLCSCHHLCWFLCRVPVCELYPHPEQEEQGRTSHMCRIIHRDRQYQCKDKGKAVSFI